MYQVAIHNNCSKYPPSESMHAWTCLIMECCTFSKIPGSLRIFCQIKKYDERSVTPFSIGPEYTYTYNSQVVPYPENIRPKLCGCFSHLSHVIHKGVSKMFKLPFTPINEKADFLAHLIKSTIFRRL